MKVKRTYGKTNLALQNDSKWNESNNDAFDKLLQSNEKTDNTKLSVKDKIRASFNRDSSLDEWKIKSERKKKAAKTRKLQKQSRSKELLESSHDEFYEAYLQGKKQKQNLKKKQMQAVSKVQVSTPVQKQLQKKHLALEFKVSPIRLDDSGQVSLENARSPNARYNSFKRQRLKEIEEAQKGLDSSAIRDAKHLLDQIQSRKALRSSENIPQRDQPVKKSTKRSSSEGSPFISKRRGTKLRKPIKAVVSDVEMDVNEDEQPPSQSSSSSLTVPSIVLTSSEISLPSSQSSSSSPSQDEKLLEVPSSPAVSARRTLKGSRMTRATKLSLLTSSLNHSLLVEPKIVQQGDKKSKAKKSVAMNLVPSVKDVTRYINDESPRNKPARQGGKKSVAFPEDLKDKFPLELNSGKWRRSLIAWRQSTKVSEESVNPIQRGRSYVEKVLSTIDQSALLEQSDDGTLQAALSILDASIKSAATFHDQRKTSQRKTSVFQRSSIFYGLQDPVINVDSQPALSARQIALRRCGQQDPLPFDEIYSESQLPNCCKIGEGVYGEVFMYKCPTTHQPIVLKIIPIEGDLLVNGEPQKRFDEILQEIVISMELSGLRHGKDFATDGFVNVKRVTCVQGAYPEHLIDEWELYRDNREEGSDNDHPEIFPADQLYVVFELCNGGRDLEAFVFNNALEAQSVFLQTALTLAIAERKFEFEHRDLHWGNILIAPTTEKFAEYRLDGKVLKLLTHGVKVTIIDYSLSRMVYDGAVLYDNLSRDEELFQSTGDYQFDIYRMMRNRVENQFERYEPFTNLLWLHYIVDKLINGARYRYSKTKKHRAAINDMMLERDELLNFTSAFDYWKHFETLES